MPGGSSTTGGSTLYTKLARSTAEQYITSQTYLPLPAVMPSELLVQRACYVTILEKPGHLTRGMYGQPMPRRSSLAEEIMMNTIAALDPTLRRADLPSLHYVIGIVSHLQRVGDASHLDPDHFGLYVRSEYGKYAVLLPQRFGIETANDQIATAFREANIDHRHEPATLYRFRVTWYD